ncbi:cupin domain-containing protein [Streptomyces sp. SID5473]|uniref:Cupin domain-containing protein n=1 Tax=Streptomyces tsukubensis (strain DSM 42081 / NBRC 108919 / NRRL 18488 / 9993) TaxID=1114943 RepID=A0A7G3UAX9_STRT9|nr:cupin domain-containing protein [Streptomyces sp. SID5473]AZK97813.1 DNA-binding protein [Streptomyces tsukubensis]MYS66850.1 cupin domain-containing protein [Streptomyces sp. SID5473]QKM66260.1 cupin domain-containing protein [Streptomyces tsukubensis NRRL18488]TAI45402.1 cupin domain-containing protein [Streptomyces tsukubensis]
MREGWPDGGTRRRAHTGCPVGRIPALRTSEGKEPVINRVRQLRKERLMTLDVLAERAGVTKSYLSKVERGHSVPSIAVGASLARALDVPLDTLFTDAEEVSDVTVTRAGDRQPLTSGEEPGSRYEGIALRAGTKRMTPFMLYPPHDADPLPFRDHPGEEFLFVHEGEIELYFPAKSVTLGPGDSAYFKATAPHKVGSLGTERAAVLLLVCDDRDAPGTPHPHLP